ncbi:hypothetical protein BHM03_00032075 [Ensete ventricosum]|nr:hypothetical protein BHM03_00032075 [Ensete ventricosum]
MIRRSSLMAWQRPSYHCCGWHCWPPRAHPLFRHPTARENVAYALLHLAQLDNLFDAIDSSCAILALIALLKSMDPAARRTSPSPSSPS